MATVTMTKSDSIRSESLSRGSRRTKEEHLTEDDNLVPSKFLGTTSIALQPQRPSNTFTQQTREETPSVSDTPDSGYGSTSSSQNSSPDDSRYHVELNSNRPIFRKKSTLRAFNKEIPDVIVSRFLDLKELFTEPLCLFLRKKGLQFNSITIRLKVLGADEESAKPFILVMCDESIKKKVRQYFNQSRVKEEFHRTEGNVPPLDVIVDGRPMSICATTEIDIYADENQLYNGTRTLCGKWIKATIGTQDRIATVGGVIEVISKRGTSHKYALTVGHLISDMKNETGHNDSAESSRADALSTSGDEDEDDEGGSDFEVVLDDNEDVAKPFTDQRSVQHGLNTKGLRDLRNISDWSRIGYVVAATANDVGGGENLDWALIEIDHSNGYLPNNFWHRTWEEDLDGSLAQFHRPMGPVFGPEVNSRGRSPRSVYLLNTRKPARHSMLSRSPSFVLMKPGTKFVEMYTVALNCEFSFGDSGTWVVGESNNNLYGHITGKDIFGDAYVMPIEAIFDDIAIQMDCALVHIPENDYGGDENLRHELFRSLENANGIELKKELLLPFSITHPSPPSSKTGGSITIELAAPTQRDFIESLPATIPAEDRPLSIDFSGITISTDGTDEKPRANPKKKEIKRSPFQPIKI